MRKTSEANKSSTGQALQTCPPLKAPYQAGLPGELQ